MLKLQVSVSWMMSRRAAAMRRERAREERWGRRESFESGGVRVVVGRKGIVGESVVAGRRKEERIV
jgi:hypothetical protein